MQKTVEGGGPAPAGRPPLRLYCFAHAGAGVTGFARWPARSGPDLDIIPVLLPGREARRRETRLTTRAGLLADLLDDMTRAAHHGPYVLYGHSLGGMVAYTLARALIDKGLPPPALVAVGACPPPDAVPANRGSELSDEQLLAFLGDLGSAPTGLLADAGSVWHRTVLPVLRDDLALGADLRAAALDPATGGPLPLPVLAVDGADDPVVGAETMDGWRRWTSGRLVRRTVPGDHFFVRGREIPRLIGRACRIVQRTEPLSGGPTVRDNR
ncbi:thioesterase II family protein [Streptomyces sp. NPDC096176]|uniref:thioesterase II family protein n=1 Tax=Streptomyces sp. NPDC096176 TaxID=3366079 RepID=UPI0038089ADC